ncbi:DDE_3 domain-containing protein [Trichonephila clavipes]|nr:DDE_3 domain-containing protein [Trichonephila clavipes]
MLDVRVFERGSVTSVKYRDEVLEPYTHLFRGACDPEFILMDNNVRPHRAILINEFLKSEDIRRMDWPVRSPDLNLIDCANDLKSKLNRVVKEQKRTNESEGGTNSRFSLCPRDPEFWEVLHIPEDACAVVVLNDNCEGCRLHDFRSWKVHQVRTYRVRHLRECRSSLTSTILKILQSVQRALISNRTVCDGSIRDPAINPLGKSLNYEFASFTTNPSEEENCDIQIHLLYSRSF